MAGARLNIKVDTATSQVIEHARATHELVPTEVIRRAVALYGIVEDATSNGARVQIAHADGSVETLRLL